MLINRPGRVRLDVPSNSNPLSKCKGLYKHLRTFKIILGLGSLGCTFGSKPESSDSELQSPKVVVVKQCQEVVDKVFVAGLPQIAQTSVTLVDKERTKFLLQILKRKESEADEANSEQVTMIYSPHPCSCPELEFRGIKVFSGVNDLFFHIFQRRQICKQRGIYCELPTVPLLPSLSDDVPLLS